jgi:hypothetical protein
LLAIDNEQDRQTYFGALNYQTKEFIIEAYPAGKGESTVKFVRKLQGRYQHKKSY